MERIHFITVRTLCTSTRYIRLVSLLTKKHIKCQVHKHVPADLYCSTSGNWGKLPCMVWWAIRISECRWCTATAASPMAQQEGERWGQDCWEVSSVPIRWQTVGTPEKPQSVCPAAPTSLLKFTSYLAEKCEQCLCPQTCSRYKISHLPKNICSSWFLL